MATFWVMSLVGINPGKAYSHLCTNCPAVFIVIDHTPEVLVFTTESFLNSVYLFTAGLASAEHVNFTKYSAQIVLFVMFSLKRTSSGLHINIGTFYVH